MCPFREMVGELSALFVSLDPEMLSLEECGSLASHQLNKSMATEKYLVRRFLSFQNLAQSNFLNSAFWLPIPDNRAGGLTKHKCDMVSI